jgi:hypothetical protein
MDFGTLPGFVPNRCIPISLLLTAGRYQIRYQLLTSDIDALHRRGFPFCGRCSCPCGWPFNVLIQKGDCRGVWRVVRTPNGGSLWEAIWELPCTTVANNIGQG